MKKRFATPPIQRRLFSWLFLLAMLATGACVQNELICCGNPDGAGSAIARLDGTWEVIAYEDLATSTRTVRDDANAQGLDVILTFEGDRIWGRCTTNEVNGKFSYTGTREISIREYGGTEIAEPRWGQMFHEAVFKFKEFTISNGTLRFFYNDGQIAVTLEKQ